MTSGIADPPSLGRHHPPSSFRPSITTTITNGMAAHVNLSDEPTAKRRKVRKGTRNCWECRRRKVRCNSATDDSCDNCRRRGTACISQEESEMPVPSTADSNKSDMRLGRGEQLIQLTGSHAGADSILSSDISEGESSAFPLRAGRSIEVCSFSVISSVYCLFYVAVLGDTAEFRKRKFRAFEPELTLLKHPQTTSRFRVFVLKFHSEASIRANPHPRDRSWAVSTARCVSL